jgi:uncharacterized membrane protein
MTAEILVLRLVHVLGGIFWLGSGMFTSFFLLPALAGAGPAAGAVMAGLQRRRLFTLLPTVAVLTMLSGLRLMMITSNGFARSYFATAQGFTFGASGVAAILAFVVGMALARPAAMRAGALGASLAAAPDESSRSALLAQLERARQRAAAANGAAIGLLVLAAAGMAVARYLR